VFDHPKTRLVVQHDTVSGGPTVTISSISPVAAAITGAALMTCGLSIAIAQQGDVMDPAQHPASPPASPVFSGDMLPLDAKLSWTERFLGDERFNPDVKLGQSATATSSGEMSMMSADEAHSGMSGMNGMDSSGIVKNIDRNQGKVKIEHGPIERMGMPGMTMVFKVADPAALQTISKDQTVEFNVDNTSGGFVITKIAPAGEMMDKESVFDARGEVQSVRATQSKIKIKHGPIDRLGMPAMTMMFSVTDPDMLSTIEKGAVIDFSVDNSSGGFVVTDLREIKEGQQ